MNDWPYLVPSLVFGLAAIAGVSYGVWQKRVARANALLATAQEYQKMQAHIKEIGIHDTLTLCYADGLEQELEHKDEEIKKTYEMLDEISIIGATYMSERNDARHQRDKLNTENDKLHAQVKLLVDELNKRGKVDEDTLATNVTQDNAKPRRTHKRQATTPESD